MYKIFLLLIIVLNLWALKKFLEPKAPVKYNNVIYSTPCRIKIEDLHLPQEVKVIEDELDRYLHYIEVKQRIINRNKESSYNFLWDDQENIKQFRKKYGLVV